MPWYLYVWLAFFLIIFPMVIWGIFLVLPLIAWYIFFTESGRNVLTNEPLQISVDNVLLFFGALMIFSASINLCRKKRGFSATIVGRYLNISLSTIAISGVLFISLTIYPLIKFDGEVKKAPDFQLFPPGSEELTQ